MKTRNLYLWLFVALFALAACGEAKAQRRDTTSQRCYCAGPELQLECYEYDFGDVPRRGGDLHLRLRYRNVGDTPLVLTRIITSCSCLKSDFSKRPLSPGAEGELELIYQPLKAAPGTFNKVVQILSNAESGRQLITIRGNSVDTKHKRDE